MNALFDIEVVGKGIAEAVKDFVGRSLHSRDAKQAIIIFTIEDTSMPLVSVGRETPVPTYALVTQPA